MRVSKAQNAGNLRCGLSGAHFDHGQAEYISILTCIGEIAKTVGDGGTDWTLNKSNEPLLKYALSVYCTYSSVH